MKHSERRAIKYTHERMKVKPYVTPSDIKDAVMYGFDAALEAVRAELSFMRNARNYINPPPTAFEQGVQAGLDYAKDRVEGMIDEELLGNPEEELLGNPEELE